MVRKGMSSMFLALLALSLFSMHAQAQSQADLIWRSILDNWANGSPNEQAPSDFPGYWEPDSDVFQTQTEYQLFVALPGVPKDSVSLEIKGNLMVLTGEKRREGQALCASQPEGMCVAVMKGRPFGRFVSRFRMPDFYDQDGIFAEFDDLGVLKIVVPKSLPVTREVLIKPIGSSSLPASLSPLKEEIDYDVDAPALKSDPQPVMDQESEDVAPQVAPPVEPVIVQGAVDVAQDVSQPEIEPAQNESEPAQTESIVLRVFSPSAAK